MIQSGHPSSHPQVLVVPLERRPLMPGVIMPVRIFDEKLIAELEEMKSRGQAYVGAFLKKSDATGPAAGKCGGRRRALRRVPELGPERRHARRGDVRAGEQHHSNRGL